MISLVFYGGGQGRNYLGCGRRSGKREGGWLLLLFALVAAAVADVCDYVCIPACVRVHVYVFKTRNIAQEQRQVDNFRAFKRCG